MDCPPSSHMALVTYWKLTGSGLLPGFCFQEWNIVDCFYPLAALSSNLKVWVDNPCWSVTWLAPKRSLFVRNLIIEKADKPLIIKIQSSNEHTQHRPTTQLISVDVQVQTVVVDIRCWWAGFFCPSNEHACAGADSGRRYHMPMGWWLTHNWVKHIGFAQFSMFVGWPAS